MKRSERMKMVKELREAYEEFLKKTGDKSFERNIRRFLEDAQESDENFSHYIVWAREDIEARILKLAEKEGKNFVYREDYMQLFEKFYFPNL